MGYHQVMQGPLSQMLESCAGNREKLFSTTNVPAPAHLLGWLCRSFRASWATGLGGRARPCGQYPGAEEAAERARPGRQWGGSVSEAHNTVIFDSSFTSCCFLKIPSHEIPAPTVCFYGSQASGWPSNAVLSRSGSGDSQGCWAPGLKRACRERRCGRPAHPAGPSPQPLSSLNTPWLTRLS